MAVKFFDKTRLDSRILGEVGPRHKFRVITACADIWPPFRFGRSPTRRTEAFSLLQALALFSDSSVMPKLEESLPPTSHSSQARYPDSMASQPAGLRSAQDHHRPLHPFKRKGVVALCVFRR